jgi:hypothetical protein
MGDSGKHKLNEADRRWYATVIQAYIHSTWLVRGGEVNSMAISMDAHEMARRCAKILEDAWWGRPLRWNKEDER